MCSRVSSIKKQKNTKQKILKKTLYIIYIANEAINISIVTVIVYALCRTLMSSVDECVEPSYRTKRSLLFNPSRNDFQEMSNRISLLEDKVNPVVHVLTYMWP